MKKISFLILFIVSGVFSQKNIGIDVVGHEVEMLFPGGKTKALILSYDDGTIHDRRLVQLMNKYHLIGTFHLNSNKLSSDNPFNYLEKAEIKSLYKGHEVSVHTANHPNLPDISKNEVVVEIVEDRKELERLMGYSVRGMSYPFGNTNDVVVETISELGIEYARTVSDTYHFAIPSDFLRWHPTVHQFAKAYWEPNQPEKDSKELDAFYKVISDFLATKELAVLDIWGHSWEMGNNDEKWNETEKFFALLSKQSTIYYAKQIDLVDYINAFKNLKFSMDNKIVSNLSSFEIYFKLGDEIKSVLPGKTVYLK
jgi:peptidoglycan/xylan/chitin deacetylase (PgdA/CDA1 family)